MAPVCIVSGGSSGIGESICKRFVEQGYQVFNLDIQPGGFGNYVACDLTQTEAINNAVTNILQQVATVDVLISNAGKHISATIEHTTEQALLELFNLNVMAAMSLTKAVLPSMKAAGSGSIIYIASDQALVAKHNSFAYNLSKHALASMAKTTALDFAQFNIRANALCPGTIETPLYHQAVDNYCKTSGEDKSNIHAQEQALQPLGRLGTPDEVAEFALFLASDNASFITGSLQVIDGGYTCQ